MLLSIGARPLIGELLNSGFSSSDILIAAVVGLVMLFVTTLATFAPARKASMIDPMRALRDE
jgi:ABC-type lipoprotein release transport system permease subunit